MDARQEPPRDELTPQETAAILRQILDAVEEGRRRHWVEVSLALLLALATMGSAWCAYQATLWGGVQTFRLAAANSAGRAAAEQSVRAIQARAFDADMFIEYIKARAHADKAVEDFLYLRFRPEMRQAVDAWLETHPFSNPEAPTSPFRTGVYRQVEEEESTRKQEESVRMLAAAQEANETSDTYVLLTVLFTAVLFFGGIGGTLQSRRMRLVMFALALALFVLTSITLVGMPTSRE